MPSRKPRVSPKKSEKPTDPTWSHAEDWNGPMTGKSTVSFNAACTCLDPKCKMEHPHRMPQDHISLWYPCKRCKTIDLYEKRMEWVKAVKEVCLEVAVSVCLLSALLASAMSAVAIVAVAIPNL